MKSIISEKKILPIPLSQPVIIGNEWKYIKDCLDSGWVSSAGDYVTRFEEVVSKFTGTKFAIATTNGTSALHLSLIACEISQNDEVIVPTLTFVAPVNTIRYCGANPIFMDCDPQTLCIDTEKLAEFMEKYTCLKDDGYAYNRETGRKIKAVIPVHVFGHPANMKELKEICDKYHLIIIEDATESLGSEFQGLKTGSFGKTGCFSFNGNKIITTGGGGMVVSDDEVLVKKIRHLSNQAKKNSFEYDHDEIGYNYRLTNILAAMGVAQMEKLNEFIFLKRKNALFYKEKISLENKVELLWEKEWAKSNFWFYTIKTPKGCKDGLIKHLASKEIQARPAWKLIHTLPVYRDFQAYCIEAAIEIYDRCINIPCSVNLKNNEMEYVVEKINEFFKS